ncbi:MAG TPA: hypothetical protein VHL78_05565 [Actinomycetota bacterium]|nr:hypothetical protein [Actinomycetota bacterium]
MGGEPPGWTPRPSRAASIGPARWKPWAALGCGVAGGFFIGVLASGSAGNNFVEILLTLPLLLGGCAAFLLNMGGAADVPVLPRLVLFPLAVSAGFRVGGALSYEVAGPPPQDLGKAASSPEGISAAILLGLSIAVALYLSLRPTRGRRADPTRATTRATPPSRGSRRGR